GESTPANDRPLLDLVLEDARGLRDQLGTGDRRKVDEYLDSLRGLEQRLDQAEEPGQSKWTPRAALDPKARPPETPPKAHAAHCRLMLDLTALAFQTDTTRVCTFMFGNSVSNQNFSFVDGVKGSHHSLSHHADKPDNLRQYQLVARWHVEQYAYLLR